MTTNPAFTKFYTSAQACSTALDNYGWLKSCAAPLVLPELGSSAPDRIEFEHVDGHHARLDDLPELASHLGHAHGAAWIAELHHAQLDRPYRACGDHTVPDFVSPRLNSVDPQVLSEFTRGPAAFYKDANLRNVLITDAGLFVTVDFDDVTLAPFGYDLAKLTVSLAMTYGPLSADALRTALRRYNQAAAQHDRTLGRTTMPEFLAMTDVHGQLTAPYLGCHGYIHPWHRPSTLLRKDRR
jgi:Phosphotransferase enzyme family